MVLTAARQKLRPKLCCVEISPRILCIPCPSTNRCFWYMHGKCMHCVNTVCPAPPPLFQATDNLSKSPAAGHYYFILSSPGTPVPSFHRVQNCMAEYGLNLVYMWVANEKIVHVRVENFREAGRVANAGAPCPAATCYNPRRKKGTRGIFFLGQANWDDLGEQETCGRSSAWARQSGRGWE